MDSMLDVFVYENSQLIESLEQVLLEGEKNKALEKEQIDEVFRIMHTIKGASAMMEFDTLAHVSHAIEDLFSLIREKAPDAAEWDSIINIVLRGMDFIKAEIDKISVGKTPDGLADEMVKEFRDYYKQLKANIAGVGATAEAGAASDGGDAPAAVAAERREGKVFRARIYFDADSQMENIRAFGIVNEFRNKNAEVVTIPSDLFGDTAAVEIAADGVTFYILTEEMADSMHNTIASTMFVKTFELDELEDDSEEIPKAIKDLMLVHEVAPTDSGKEADKTDDDKKPAVAAAAAVQQPTEIANKPSFISVNVTKLDGLLNLVGEIVTTESMVTRNPEIEGLQLDSFEKAAQQLRKLTDELQDIVMSIRMVPVSSTFHKMQRLVRDMSRKVSKEVDLHLIGEDTEVDKSINDNLADPLMHMIRNSVDHGIETANDRVAVGKSTRGNITLEARNTGGDIMIIVTDDGRGLDRNKLLAKAADKGLLTKPEADYTDREAYNMIFAAGFSTNSNVTEFSGRGVGMDVVRRNIDNIGGTVTIDSTPGKGMTTTIRIPLTLAIVDGMRVKVGSQVYIMPVLSIRQSFKPKKGEAFLDPDGHELIMVRGVCYRVVRLGKAFGIPGGAENLEDGILIMVESSDDAPVCLFADQLIGEQQAVVKPMPGYITRKADKLYGISGCTVLGDGSISLILDINSLVTI